MAAGEWFHPGPWKAGGTDEHLAWRGVDAALCHTVALISNIITMKVYFPWKCAPCADPFPPFLL